MNKEKLKEIIAYLETNKEVEGIDHPNYDSKIYELLASLDLDINYSDNYAKIADKKIAEMTIAELGTMYTYLLRGERFCEGLIASYVEDGSLLDLARRHLELIK